MNKNILMWISLWIALVIIILGTWLVIPVTFWQYFFLLRAPIVMGLLLFFLPVIAKFLLPSMLKNLFVLRGIWQIGFTVLGATIAAMAVTFSLFTILDNAPARFDLPSLLPISSLSYYILAIALALPTTITVIDLSHEELKDKKWQGIEVRWWGLLVGILFSGLFLFAFKEIRNFLKTQEFSGQLLVKVISFLAKHSTAGYIEPTGNLANTHINAFAFFLTLLIGYSLIFIIYQPRSVRTKGEAAALVYLVLLVAIATLFLGSLTFYFDYFRVSILLFWLLITVLMYWLFKVEHFFELKEDDLKNKNTNQELQDFKAVINKRLAKLKLYLETNGEKTLTEEQKRTLVVVCASGGGIQAAGWTAKVLTSLQEDHLLGKSFSKAIGLISSVSGGSVGSMYYLDHFDDLGYPPDELSDKIFNSATANSLDAVGWGLAYPDLWRIIALPILPSILTPQISDRGIALQTNWQAEMAEPNKPKTLANWRTQILDGNLPIPVFNATLVEDGFRLLITPMTFVDPKENKENNEKKYYDFNSLYPDYDTDLVTAARLSASFPYISPLARSNQDIEPNYHVGDGGYFDNSGFVTAVEWLNKWLVPLNIKRVLILQINPFPKSEATTQTRENKGLFMATLGPLLTLFKVRSPILQARNLTEVELLKQRWRDEEEVLETICAEQQIKIEYFPIFFPSQEEFPPEEADKFYNEQGEYQPPLSWKLTQKEKDAIEAGWDAIKEEEPIEKIRTLWRDEWGM